VTAGLCAAATSPRCADHFAADDFDLDDLVATTQGFVDQLGCLPALEERTAFWVVHRIHVV
jgi:hypothetical protein